MKEKSTWGNDANTWRGMHRGVVRGKGFEASRRARPHKAQRRANREVREREVSKKGGTW